MLRAVLDKLESMQEHMGYVNWDGNAKENTLPPTQKKTPNTRDQKCNRNEECFGGLISRLHIAKQRIWLEDIRKPSKTGKRKQTTLLWDNHKSCQWWVTGIIEKKRWTEETESIISIESKLNQSWSWINLFLECFPKQNAAPWNGFTGALCWIFKEEIIPFFYNFSQNERQRE